MNLTRCLRPIDTQQIVTSDDVTAEVSGLDLKPRKWMQSISSIDWSVNYIFDYFYNVRRILVAFPCVDSRCFVRAAVQRSADSRKQQTDSSEKLETGNVAFLHEKWKLLIDY